VDVACGINDLQDIACKTMTFFSYVLMNVELPCHVNCELGFKNLNEIVDWIIVKGFPIQKNKNKITDVVIRAINRCIASVTS